MNTDPTTPPIDFVPDVRALYDSYWRTVRDTIARTGTQAPRWSTIYNANYYHVTVHALNAVIDMANESHRYGLTLDEFTSGLHLLLVDVQAAQHSWQAQSMHIHHAPMLHGRPLIQRFMDLLLRRHHP